MPPASSKSRALKARPALPPIVARAEEDDAGLLSPWEWHGWGISVAVHALLLLILVFWYINPKPSQVKTFDTRLAGSEFGVDDGLNSLGGLDAPVTLPDPSPAPTVADEAFSRLRPSDLVANPSAGFAGGNANIGAGQGDGFGLARFGKGGESVRGVEVQVGDPQFTLLWDSRADIDLHVIEPGGKEIFWNDTKGRFGGELDVDNTDGFGPENIYWLRQKPDGSKELGPGPPGQYKWFVKYYGGNGGVPVKTRWKVRIKHEGRVEILQGTLTVPGSDSKVLTLTVGGPSTP